MAEIAKLDYDQQSKVVGRGNLQLIEAKVVTWEDVVTRGRIRDLNQVVATKRLSLTTLLDAGIRPQDAKRAYESVHTPAHELARKQRQDLVDRLKAAGIKREELKKLVGERIAARISIGQGPSGPQPSGITPTPPPKPTPPVKPPPVVKPKPPVLPPKPTPPKPRPKVPTPLPVPVPALVRQKADYLVKARVKPEVALVSARREQVKRRLAEIGPELVPLEAEMQAKFQAMQAAPLGSAAKTAARSEYFAAAAKLDALKDLQARLTKWETEVAVNPKLVPPWEIKDRLAEYDTAGGGAKVQAIAEAVAPVKAAEAPKLAAQKAVEEHLATLRAIPEGTPEFARAFQEHARLLDAVQDASNAFIEANRQARKRAAEILGASKALEIERAAQTMADPQVTPLPAIMDSVVKPGLDWLSKITEAAGTSRQQIPFGHVSDRAYHNKHGIALDPASGVPTVVHEFGHYLEMHVGNIGQAARDFLKHRVGNEPLRKLKEVRSGYDDDEVGRKDRFEDAWPDEASAYYVGKHYAGDTTEITAMGLELLYNSPYRLAKDREFLLFILGVLDGSLR